MAGKRLTGVEGDRAVIRGAALRIIREVLEKPDFDKVKRSDVRKDWLAPPPLSAFTHLEPLGFGVVDDDWWVFSPHECPPDVAWPLDIGIICENAGNDLGLAMARVYTITPRQARGCASRFSPFMIRMDYAQMMHGQLMRAAMLRAWLGGKWVQAERRTIWETEIPKKPDETDATGRLFPCVATALALRQRYEWAVSLGLEASPSIRFATDPTGIKEIFKIRDLPEGKDRREALMTWVSDHWRQDRDDPDMEIYVRKHLRGATMFTWRGMNCELLPSKFDVDQREKLIAKRDAMRMAGSDRRLVS